MPANFLGAACFFQNAYIISCGNLNLAFCELTRESSFKKFCFEEEISNDFAVMARVQLTWK